jgi:hypothetical protein
MLPVSPKTGETPIPARAGFRCRTGTLALSLGGTGKAPACLPAPPPGPHVSNSAIFYGVSSPFMI